MNFGFILILLCSTFVTNKEASKNLKRKNMKLKMNTQKNNFTRLTKVLIIVALITLGLKANAQCTAGFTYTVNPTNSNEILFTQTSTGIGTNVMYGWNYGDGGYDNVQNPTHLFTKSGVYEVCLGILDSLNYCQSSFCDTIVIDNGICSTSFYEVQDSVDTPKWAFYPSTSFGTPPYTYFWDFADGVTSNLKNPSHQYNDLSGHYICLTVTDAKNMQCKSCKYVKDSIYTSCNTSFVYSADLTSLNTIKFYSSVPSDPNTYTYLWTFADGTTSTLQNPIHQFSYPYYYNVCLKTTDSNGIECNICRNVNVVNSNNSLCNAAFNIVKDTMNLNSYFAYIYYPNNYSTSWDFGDGTTSTLQYPMHQYTGSGPYRLCLTVTGDSACSDTYCDTLYAGRSSSGITFTVINPLTRVPEKNIKYSTLLNYPNPFSKTTTIVYSTEQNSTIELNVIDLLGKKIALLDSGNKTDGNHTIQWNAENVAPGIYLLQLKVNNEISTKKLIVTQ